MDHYSGKTTSGRFNDIAVRDKETELNLPRNRRHIEAPTPTVHFADDTLGKSPKKNEATSVSNKVSISPFDRGDMVEAKFRGRGSRWYKGRISDVKTDGTFDVDYDDGDRDTGLHADSIRLKVAKQQSKRSTQESDTSKRNVKIVVGTKVESRYRGKSMFYPGKISRVRLNGTFDVDYDDGSKEMGVCGEMIKLIDTDLDESDGDSASMSVSSGSSATPSTKETTVFDQGDLVEAKFRGKGSKWYKGKITHVHMDGTYDVGYDDGDRDIHLSSDLIRIVEQTTQEIIMKTNEETKLKIGMDVEARLRGESKYYPGKISRVRLNGTYDISYDNGQGELSVESGLIRITKTKSSLDSAHDSASLKKGTKVEGRYRGGGKFYKGAIVSVNADGTFDIVYDDGKKELNVEQRLIRCLQNIDKERVTENDENDEKSKKETNQQELFLKEGDRVEAKFRGKGKKWYKGVISRVRLNSTFDVDYDDGDNDSALSANFIRKVKDLSLTKEERTPHQHVVGEPSAPKNMVVGSRVEAQYRGRSKYYPGKISRVRLNGTFDIAYDNGEKELGVSISLIRAIANVAEKSTKENHDNRKGIRFDTARSSPIGNEENNTEKIVALRTLKVGDRIEAKFLGKLDYCQGKIVRARLNGTFDIEYDNGEKESSVTRDLIKSLGNIAHNCDGKNGVVIGSSSGMSTKTFRSGDDVLHLFSEGDAVESRFRGRGSRWYKGRISRVSSNGTYDIDYDDGDHDTGLPSNSIRLAQTNEKNEVDSPSKTELRGNDNERLKVGSRVEAKYRGKSKYHPGTISRIRLNGKFDIDFDDGEKEVSVPHDFIRTETQIVKPVTIKSKRKEDTPKKNSSYLLADNENVPMDRATFVGKGNRWHKGVISKVKVVYLYEVEYDDDQKDVNLPAEALRKTDIDIQTPKTGEHLKVGESVEVLSWQDRFVGFS